MVEATDRREQQHTSAQEARHVSELHHRGTEAPGDPAAAIRNRISLCLRGELRRFAPRDGLPPLQDCAGIAPVHLTASAAPRMSSSSTRSRLRLVPIVLGHGVRIWDGLYALEDAFDIEAISTPSGVTHLTFTAKPR